MYTLIFISNEITLKPIITVNFKKNIHITQYTVLKNNKLLKYMYIHKIVLCIYIQFGLKHLHVKISLQIFKVQFVIIIYDLL